MERFRGVDSRNFISRSAVLPNSTNIRNMQDQPSRDFAQKVHRNLEEEPRKLLRRSSSLHRRSFAEAPQKIVSNLSIVEADACLALHRSLNLRVKMKANVCLFVYSHRLACQIFSRNKMIGESKSVKFARGKARLLRPF